ncbi:MAG TPA: hypothetical protein DEB06_10625 [Phycisphaerales bacterium]|nr:hypothetical protein [Phycisphaerales bacterium]
MPFESSSSLDVRDLSMLDPDGPGPEHGVLLATTRRYAVYWDGADWRTFGRAALWRPDEPEPAQPTRGTIHAIRAFDEDKGGPRPASVFVGGEFLKVDDAYATGVAKWSCVFEIQRCLADIDASGTVDFGDVFQILQDWSSVDRPQSDANRDGRVNFNDVSMVLGVWSAPCSARRLGDMPPEAERLADAPLVGFESLDSLAEALLRHGGDAPIGSQPD